jgi:drug/metabolite transporter (DMT)-like permease
MNRLLSNIRLVVGFASLWVVASILATYITGKWHWFGRSGAIVTVVGLILSVRPFVRMGLAKWLRSQTVLDYGHIEPTPEELEEERQSTLDAKASKIGLTMAIVGTVVWAYGDLVGGLP